MTRLLADLDGWGSWRKTRAVAGTRVPSTRRDESRVASMASMAPFTSAPSTTTTRGPPAGALKCSSSSLAQRDGAEDSRTRRRVSWGCGSPADGAKET